MSAPRNALRLFSAAGAVLLALAACGHPQPGPSHVGPPYRGKLVDDIMVEAATTVLVTNKDVVIALDCNQLSYALTNNDRKALDDEIARGLAARLPANVTVYTPPFSPNNDKRWPLVVTDDKYAGTLCTPNAYDVVKS